MTSQRTFLPNLLVMHALLFVSLLPGRTTLMGNNSPAKKGHSGTNEETEEEKFLIYVKNLYRVIQLASAAIHIRTALTTVKYLQQGSFGSHILETAWKVSPSPIIYRVGRCVDQHFLRRMDCHKTCAPISGLEICHDALSFACNTDSFRWRYGAICPSIQRHAIGDN